MEMLYIGLGIVVIVIIIWFLAQYGWIIPNQKQQQKQLNRVRFGDADFMPEERFENYRCKTWTGNPKKRDVQVYQHRGVYIGDDILYGSRYYNGSPVPVNQQKALCFRDEGHLLTIASTGAGKGASLIIPNLLDRGDCYDGSWVVIDPKGQNAYITSGWQRKAGREVIILNPWQIYTKKLGSGDTFNPLSILKDSKENFWEDCKMIAEMVVPVSQGKDQHWHQSARGFLTLVIAHITMQNNVIPTFEAIKRAISPIGGDIDELLREMGENTGNYWSEMINDEANQWMTIKGGVDEDSSREFSSIMSTLYNALRRLTSSRIFVNTQNSSFDFNVLSQEKCCLYIVIPSERLGTGQQWLRLVIATLMRSIVRNRGAKYRTTFILDEFASLGYVKEFETAVQQYRGYNIFIWPFLQSLTQLKNLYPKSWGTFLDCASVQHFFGINSYETAKYVSDISGNTSVMSLNQNYRTVGSGNQQQTVEYFTEGTSTSRPLLYPYEIMSEKNGTTTLYTKIKKELIAGLHTCNYYHDEAPERNRAAKDIPDELK